MVDDAVNERVEIDLECAAGAEATGDGANGSLGRVLRPGEHEAMVPNRFARRAAIVDQSVSCMLRLPQNSRNVRGLRRPSICIWMRA